MRLRNGWFEVKFPEEAYEDFEKTLGYPSDPVSDCMRSARWGFEEAKKQLLAKIKEALIKLNEQHKKEFDSTIPSIPNLQFMEGEEKALKWLEGELK